LRMAYEKVAPRPQDWPTLVSKVMKQGATFKGWNPDEMRTIKATAVKILAWRKPLHRQRKSVQSGC
jgi:hypothetical protein